MSQREMDGTVRRALDGAAGELQAIAAYLPGWAAAEGATGVRPADLQRALCGALQSQLGAVACVDGPLPEGVKEHWAGWLGRADVLVREAGRETYFETQLCGVEKLHESLWDSLKLALFTALEPGRDAYLLYAAPDSAWAREVQHPEEIFAGGAFAVEELLHGAWAEMWEWCLRGTRTTRPLALPASLRTSPIATSTLRSPTVEWRLRCVRIEGDAAAGWVRFDQDGWPLAGATLEPSAAFAGGEMAPGEPGA